MTRAERRRVAQWLALSESPTDPLDALVRELAEMGIVEIVDYLAKAALFERYYAATRNRASWSS